MEGIGKVREQRGGEVLCECDWVMDYGCGRLGFELVDAISRDWSNDASHLYRDENETYKSVI